MNNYEYSFGKFISDNVGNFQNLFDLYHIVNKNSKKNTSQLIKIDETLECDIRYNTMIDSIDKLNTKFNEMIYHIKENTILENELRLGDYKKDEK